MTTDVVFTKTPTAELDWLFDWAPLTNATPGGVADWLAAGEAIDSYTLVISPNDGNLTIDSHALANSDTSVLMWLSGGLDNVTYEIKCSIVTNNSPPRKDNRTIVIKVR